MPFHVTHCVVHCGTPIIGQSGTFIYRKSIIDAMPQHFMLFVSEAYLVDTCC